MKKICLLYFPSFKIFFFSLSCCLIFNCSFSQSITFEKWYNFGYTENGFSVEQTFDGGYIVSGRHGISFVTSELILHKVDSLGNTQWTKLIKSGPYEHEGYDVKQTADSGYIVSGMMDDIFPLGANIYLVKTDKYGDTLWTKYYGGINYDNGFSVVPTFDGGYAIAAQYDTLAMLLKTNSNGDTLWTKKYLPSSAWQSTIRSVQQLSDSGYILTGSVSYYTPPAALYIIRTDKNGDTLWTKQYFGAGWQIGNSIDENSDGGFIISGWTGGSDNDCYLVRTNSVGDTLWTKTFGGTGDESAKQTHQTSDGGFILAGSATSFGVGDDDIYLVKTDSDGNFLWQKTFGGLGGDYGYDMDLTTDVGFIIVGTGSNNSLSCVYLIKTDSGGNVFTSIADYEQNNFPIILYPNPADNSVNIVSPKNISGEILLSDMAGRIIKREQFIGASQEMLTSDLNNGIYIAQVISENKNISNIKLIIKH